MRSLHLFFLALAVLAAGCNCGKKPAAPSQLKEGEACENDERCETGLCDAAPGFSPVCVRRCADGCEPTEVCVQLTPNRFACQPDQRKLCQPCVADLDCPYPSDKCIVVNTEKVCGRDCAFDQYCPTGYRCVNAQGIDGQPKVQQCVPIVASCACLARGDFEQPCQNVNAEGTCTGLKKCDLVSNSVVCDARQAVSETCNGLDDDCDGDTDEGQMTATCGVGACARTTATCVDGGVASCTPGMPITELCNGIDDDCDGTLDNGFDTTTSITSCGACGRVCTLPHATPRCDVGVCRVLTCDPGYDNCNGLDPDGCESNVSMDPMNCGACNAACVRPHSTATCSNSTCSFVCAPGWVDLNNDPLDGCEYNCTFTSATDVPDLLFTDANCDGIDGELNNGIFVSPAGLDSNPGTRAAPKQTLGAAMTAVVTNGKRDVYLAEGTYTGPLDLLGVSGINVAGAYHATTWARAFTQQVVVNNGNPALNVDGSNNVLIQAIRFEAANGTASERSSYGAKIVEAQGIRLESLDIRAGNGLAGAAGSSPGAAANGNPGSGGLEGCYNDPRFSPAEIAIACNFNLFLDYCSSARPGGGGGASSCGANGGSGGSPTRYNPSGTPTGSSGGPGLPSGGAGGQGVPAGVTPPVGSIYWGADGASGTAGNNGSAASAGTFNNSGFVLSSAQNGTSGTAGRGGGGGGGGAGGLGLPLGGIYAGISCYSYGSAGSGGGSAGCGGNAGGAGGSGGASIGIFLYNAQVTSQAAVVRSGNGGAGGAGGAGGSGGIGAGGGTSGYASEQGQATRAGGGGRGGNGGAGGHGGGGAGGSVYGIAKNAGSTWSPTGGSVTLGTPGTGGTSPGNPGAAGASGVQTTF
ncbi:MAG: hypothetical protein Q8L48_34930 [Archangium sp.]|nr:hypothetical protein [Archangium sp.]